MRRLFRPESQRPFFPDVSLLPSQVMRSGVNSGRGQRRRELLNFPAIGECASIYRTTQLCSAALRRVIVPQTRLSYGPD